MFASNPGTYETLILEISKINPNNLQYAFLSLHSDVSHRILPMEPTSNRGVFEKRFASRYVFELL